MERPASHLLELVKAGTEVLKAFASASMTIRRDNSRTAPLGGRGGGGYEYVDVPQFQAKVLFVSGGIRVQGALSV